LTALLLDLDTGGEILGHLLSGDAHELSFKFEALSWFESQINFLLRFSVNESFLRIETETVFQDALNFSLVFGAFALDNRHHLQLNVEVAVTLVGNVELKSLGEADSYGSKVQIVRVNGNQAIRTSSNNLQFLSDSLNASHCSGDVGVTSQTESRARVVETDVVLNFVKLVSSEDRDAHGVLLLLKWRKGRSHFGLLVRQKQASHRGEDNLRPVLVGDTPFVLDGDSGIVLDTELLLGANTDVGG